jgi:hypothetical protein
MANPSEFLSLANPWMKPYRKEQGTQKTTQQLVGGWEHLFKKYVFIS